MGVNNREGNAAFQVAGTEKGKTVITQRKERIMRENKGNKEYRRDLVLGQ